MRVLTPTFFIPDATNRQSGVFLSEESRVGSPQEISTGRNTSAPDLPTYLRNGDSGVDSRSQVPLRRYAPPVVPGNFRTAESADATVIQIWEGKVLRVDRERAVMEVSLEARIGAIPPHAAEIELQWVSDQDMDLIEPGAIFYLTLFKRTRNRTVENSQELRFRRLPAWTRQQVAHIHEDAKRLLAKMKERPQAK